MNCQLHYQTQGCIGCSESVCLEDLCECGELPEDCCCKVCKGCGWEGTESELHCDRGGHNFVCPECKKEI